MKHIKIILLSMLSSALMIVLAISIFHFFNWIAETFSGTASIIVAVFLFLTLLYSIGFYKE